MYICMHAYIHTVYIYIHMYSCSVHIYIYIYIAFTAKTPIHRRYGHVCVKSKMYVLFTKPFHNRLLNPSLCT